MTYEEKLDHGLLLRTIRDEQDVDAYVAFNAEYNNPNEGLNTNCLIRHYPGAGYEDYQLIEEEQTGRIVSTTCLIPWGFSFEGIPLRAAQLEQVLTHPDYRRHGLVKTQIKRFMRRVSERSFDLSFIWGIPYYYRQYGYAYCLDGNAYESLPTWRIPDAAAGVPGRYTLRSATLDDIPVLTDLYQKAMRSQQVSVIRSQEHWRYLLEWARLPVWVIEDQPGRNPVGYLGMVKQATPACIHIIESGVVNQEVGRAVLGALKQESVDEIRVSWPQNGSMARLASVMGSVTQPGGQWLFNIPDLAGFLTKIGPVFERRLAASDCEGLTQNLTVNLFRQAYRLCFLAGKLERVESLGFVDSSMGADGGDLCIPPDAFTRLLLGYRCLDELMDAWPDIVIKTESRHRVDVLFPRLASYLYATYSYFG